MARAPPRGHNASASRPSASRLIALAICAALFFLALSRRVSTLPGRALVQPGLFTLGRTPEPVSLAIISLYFGGSLPWYANYWAESCGTQHAGIDCIIVIVAGVTDAPGLALCPDPAARFACRGEALPQNVYVLEISGSDFRDLFELSTGFALHAMANELDFRKMADFKPLYGSLLLQHTWRILLRNYTHWGWSDIDQVLGDVWGLTSGLGSEGAAAAGPPVDLWAWFFEGGWEPPLMAGQLGVARNSPPIVNLWRHHGAGLADIFRSPDYKEFDEREFGAVVFRLASQSSSPQPGPTTPVLGGAAAATATAVTADAAAALPSPPPPRTVFIDDSGVQRPLRVRAVLDGAFSDMLAVCHSDARRWRIWWERGRLWGAQCVPRSSNRSTAGTSEPATGTEQPAPETWGQPKEGAYFHFMCAKWSHALWRPVGRLCEAHAGDPWRSPRWNITFTTDPLSMAFHSGPAIMDAPAAPRQQRRRLYMSVADDAVLTFHDASWGVRPQLGCA
jgi:hypothetical protein